MNEELYKNFIILSQKSKIDDSLINDLILFNTMSYGFSGVSKFKLNNEFLRFLLSTITDYNNLIDYSKSVLKINKKQLFFSKIFYYLYKFKIIKWNTYADQSNQSLIVFIHNNQIRNISGNLVINLRNIFYLLDLLNKSIQKEIGITAIKNTYFEEIKDIRDSIIHLEADIKRNNHNISSFTLFHYDNDLIHYYDDKTNKNKTFSFDKIESVIKDLIEIAKKINT